MTATPPAAKRLPSRAGRYAGCTALAAAHRKGPRTGIWRHGWRSYEATGLRRIGWEPALEAPEVVDQITDDLQRCKPGE